MLYELLTTTQTGKTLNIHLMAQYIAKTWHTYIMEYYMTIN